MYLVEEPSDALSVVIVGGVDPDDTNESDNVLQL